MRKRESESKKRRHLKNLLVFPRLQLKYAILGALFVSFSWAASIGMMYFFSDFFQNNRVITERQNILSEAFGDLLVAQAVLAIISVMFTFGINLAIGHRFFGPMVAIIRYFDALKVEPNASLKVRKGDDAMLALIDYLKSLKISVRDESSPAFKDDLTR